MRRATMRPNAQRSMWCVEDAAGLSLPQVGAGGPPPGIFFANISSEKGILGQFKDLEREKKD